MYDMRPFRALSFAGGVSTPFTGALVVEVELSGDAGELLSLRLSVVSEALVGETGSVARGGGSGEGFVCDAQLDSGELPADMAAGGECLPADEGDIGECLPADMAAGGECLLGVGGECLPADEGAGGECLPADEGVGGERLPGDMVAGGDCLPGAAGGERLPADEAAGGEWLPLATTGRATSSAGSNGRPKTGTLRLALRMRPSPGGGHGRRTIRVPGMIDLLGGRGRTGRGLTGPGSSLCTSGARSAGLACGGEAGGDRTGSARCAPVGRAASPGRSVGRAASARGAASGPAAVRRAATAAGSRPSKARASAGRTRSRRLQLSREAARTPASGSLQPARTASETAGETSGRQVRVLPRKVAAAWRRDAGCLRSETVLARRRAASWETPAAAWWKIASAASRADSRITAFFVQARARRAGRRASAAKWANGA